MTSRTARTNQNTANTVKDDLTVNRPADQAKTGRPVAGSKRRKPGVENTDYAAFAARVIRGYARRIADGDVDGLAELVELTRELDAATGRAVDGLRACGYSWTEIATRMGTTRQAAQQRWGTKARAKRTKPPAADEPTLF
jgi:hypothetical protein